MPNEKLIVPVSPIADVPRIALSRRETSHSLGVSVGTVDTWIRNEGLPSVQIGRCRLIPVLELRQWVSERLRAAAINDAPP